MKRILIVDDDPIVLQSCRRILEADGCRVGVADSVEVGVALLSAESFDLVLTDIKMPGQDGFDMIQRARCINPALPILMMTGYLTAETVVAGRRAGANDCIAKPFIPKELVAAVRALVEKP